MSSLKFGTSGVRGLVVDLVGRPSFSYALAFLLTLDRSEGTNTLLIGHDLRASSPDIAATVAAAAHAAGFEPHDCGALPTPALALEATRQGAAAIMITGSHIPDDRNGLKFYRRDGGEITKADETAITAALDDARLVAMPETAIRSVDGSAAIERYLRRYCDAFASDTLAGMTIAVYQQSTVGRDVLTKVLTALGAQAVPIGRSDTFIPIDTEAHRPEDVAFIRATMASGQYDALVTMDGDADRPLVADATGRILRGDILGLLTARFLGLDTVVVPVTAGSAIERSGGFARVLRTKVGSPHVIAGMDEAVARGARLVAGFEANGGFLLGSTLALGSRSLAALPTRDAVLPIVATLAAARRAGCSLADLVAALQASETASDRLENVPTEKSRDLLTGLEDEDALSAFLQPVGKPVAVTRVDGLRVTLDGERTIHLRPSGNAPELRCYAEADSLQKAEELVRWGLSRALSAIS